MFKIKRQLMKYFGVLKKDTFGKLNNIEKVDHLIINHLFDYAQEKIYISEGIVHEFKQEKLPLISSAKSFLFTMVEFLSLVKKNGLKNDSFYYIDEFDKTIMVFIEENNETKCVKLAPTHGLLDDFYSFLMDKYVDKILSAKYQFYEGFNEDIFGLESDKQKIIALKRYKEIYNSLFQGNATYIPDSYIEKDLNDFTIYNKLDLVVYNKLNYQHNLINLNSYFEYLCANTSHFNDDFHIKNQETIDSIIKYESLKQIMEEINEKFNFESNNENVIKKEIKQEAPKNDIKPFLNFITHDNNTEIERIIKLHYSDLRGVSLRYLIEFLKGEGLILIGYGDNTKLRNSFIQLFNNNDVGKYQSIFGSTVFKTNDPKYIDFKISFQKKFKEFI
jgi:hypothetical protein